MTGWHDVRNAELYDEFARTYGLYRDTSRDLVDLARVEQAGLVVDLACGTGVTTESILARVRASTTVVGIDASEPMLAIARGAVKDERVRWILAPAVDLATRVSDADAIVCNSAIWQLDMEATLAAAARTLKPGGRLAFNIGRQFLMLPLTPEELRPAKPTFAHLIQAIAVLEYDFVPPHPAASRRGPRMTPESVGEMVARAGLVIEDTHAFEYDSPPEEQLAWLRVPVFAQNVLPGMAHEDQLAVLAKAYERWDKPQDLKSRWIAFVARKP